MNFTLINLFNISVIASVLTLIIYHYFIYWGRRGNSKEKQYYVYFCLFTINFLLYLSCVCSLQKYIFRTEEIRQMISPAITGTCFFLMLHFVIKTFKIIFKFPANKNKLLLPFYLPYIVYFILLSTYPFLDYDFYFNNFYSVEAYIGTATTIYMYAFFTIHFFKSKELRKDLASMFILLMFFIFMADFFMEEIFTLLDINYPLKGTYLFSGISVLIWAYALAVRFNNEHHELRTLKNSLEDKVKERTLQIKLANEQKESTFINLAHETRTPLTLIKNCLDDYSHKYGNNTEIERIKHHSSQINNLIGNILNIEKFEKGHEIYIHDKVIDISDFLFKKIKHFSSYVAKKKLKLVNDIQEHIKIKIAPDALESLIDNLLINAIKFTPKGSIEVNLQTDASNIVLSIKDTGIGIPANIQERIFEPYFHFSDKRNSGFGMGLAIVSNVVDSVKGKIKVYSEIDKGTEFNISLPSYQISEDEDIYNSDKFARTAIEPTDIIVEDAVSDENKPFVFIIEDHPELLIYLRDKLKKRYNIYVSSSCDEALPKLESCNNKPELIIADIMMEGMEGIEFLENLKGTEFDHIPLIFITAKTSPEDRDKALSLGALDFITKPFDISEVRQKVNSIVDVVKKQKEHALNSLKELMFSNAQNDKKMIGEQPLNFDSICKKYHISKREKDIINLAQEGHSYSKIANELGISPKTVDNHFQNIFKKTGVNQQKDLFDKLHV